MYLVNRPLTANDSVLPPAVEYIFISTTSVVFEFYVLISLLLKL